MAENKSVGYVAPAVSISAFTCPHCNAYAQQESVMTYALYYKTRKCGACSKTTYWHNDNLVYPSVSIGPIANADMPEDVRKTYDEARAVSGRSAKAAAALLRLALQQLLPLVGASGKNINDMIGDLVQKGLSPEVQKAMDSVRVVGNNAVHPGTIDLNDNTKSVETLFKLTNYIVEKMITDKRLLNELYASLPENSLKGIEGRDKPKT